MKLPKRPKPKSPNGGIIQRVGDQALDIQSSSTKHLKKHVLRRFDHVAQAWRFVAGWLLLVVSMIGLTSIVALQIYNAAHITKPITGGTYVEGMVGTINNLNPLFTGGVLDESTDRLIFNGLLRYNSEGVLVPDLAQSWNIEPDNKTYSVKLRSDVVWHDGQPFTADDVVYTIQTIQNPLTRSTLISGWRGVTISAPSKYEVKITLPATLASFTDSLTVPIVPKHLLEETKPELLRTATFNTEPVGTGPFRVQVLRTVREHQQLELKKNTAYHRGQPKLDRFIVRTFANNESMREALENREITAAVDLPASEAQELARDTSIQVENVPLYSAMFAFFKTTNPVLSDVKVRTALAEAVDRQDILKLFNAQYPPLKNPLLPNQLGFSAEYGQVTNIAEANTLLDEAGWPKQSDGIRAKDGARLELNLVTLDAADQSKVVSLLQKQWRKLGVVIKPTLLTAEQLSQNALVAHDYDILLYGISVDRDPDVYAYWHSTQAQPGGSNFSEWKSSRADASLDVARTRLDTVLRSARYQTFQDEWKKSSPAVALYQLQTTYASHRNAAGYVPVVSTNAADRLTNVEEWTVNTKSTLRTP